MAVAQVLLVSIGFPGTHANVLPDSKVTAGLDANRPKSERVRKFCMLLFSNLILIRQAVSQAPNVLRNYLEIYG